MTKHLLAHKDDSADNLMARLGSSRPQSLVALFLSASLLAACGGGKGEADSAAADAGQSEGILADSRFLLIGPDEEPAAGLGFGDRNAADRVHQEKMAVTTKATATTPVIIKAPAFAAPNAVVRVGQPVTRVIGQYRNGLPVAGSRTRNGVDIPNGKQASYTPTQADVGKRLVYLEEVRNPRTGERIVAQSAPVVVVSSTAPIARKAPKFGPDRKVVRVGERITRQVGEYENGEPFEGFRLRNGQPVANGQGADYVPVAADVGQVLVYGERVRNPHTGEVITVYSQEVTVVAANSTATRPSTPPTAQPTAPVTNPVSSTAPTMSVAPLFGPADQQLVVGVPVTRVSGTYQNGTAFEGFRLRNGVEISNGYAASYTPVAADVGQKIVYGERVRNPRTGEVKTFYSAEVTVVDNSAATQVKAPALTVRETAQVGQRLSYTTGTYQNGQIYAHQWLRDDLEIPGATQSSYTTTSADVGKRISVAERVRNPRNGKEVNFYTNYVVVRAADASIARSMPRISVGTGNAIVGRQVQRTLGQYSSGQILNAIWYVNNEAKGWGPHYTPTAADVGKTLVYTEEVRSPSGQIVNFSAPGVQIVHATAQPAPPPAPTPVSSTASSGKVNSVQTIIDDMRLYNEGELAGVNKGMGWASGPGFVVMGNIPRGTNTPGYWRPANTYFKSNATWNAVIPWLVVFDGVGNRATNTRVQIKPIKLYMKRKSNNRWELIVNTPISGEDYPKSLQGSNTTTPNLRYNADGTRSLKPHGGNRVFHGWGHTRAFDAWDLKALVVTTQARLVVDNPARADDRHLAKYLIHVGADYYPEASTRVNETAPAYYFPGVGVSRAKYVRNEWRAFNFSTIDAGKPEPGGSIPTQELRDNPPPLE